MTGQVHGSCSWIRFMSWIYQLTPIPAIPGQPIIITSGLSTRVFQIRLKDIHKQNAICAYPGITPKFHRFKANIIQMRRDLDSRYSMLIRKNMRTVVFHNNSFFAPYITWGPCMGARMKLCNIHCITHALSWWSGAGQ